MKDDCCEGCLTYEKDSEVLSNNYEWIVNHCALGINPHISETKECPCLTCLIKGICIDACEKLINYGAIAANRKHSREAWRKRKDGG
jgi:hypothetical protein